MVAFAFSLPYHVLRTAAAAGVRVHVLGSGASRGLRMSRYCRGYRESRFAGDPEALAAEIAELVACEAIEVVFPSDDVSTRLLAALAPCLPVRTTPLPELAAFDLLNDKWNFTRFCEENGIRAAPGSLFASGEALRRAVDAGEAALPLTVKPINRSGGFGVLHLRGAADLAALDRVDYRPILAQRHIVGETIGISVLCDRGRVVAHAVQRRENGRFQLFAEPELVADVTRLAALTGLNGPANFDAVLADADRRSYLVECNPRFWYSIYMAMIAGLNFVGLALDQAFGEAPGADTSLARGEFSLSWSDILARPWRATRSDWRLLRYDVSDPLAYLLRRANSYDDSDVAVPIADMSRYRGIQRPAVT